jgi:hypothetical protein
MHPFSAQPAARHLDDLVARQKFEPGY